MYDYEIANYIHDKDYNLSSKEYLYVVSTSPQINWVKYENNRFYITTDDGNEFCFEVHKD